LADNILIDERGILNRDLASVDYGLKQLSQPIHSTSAAQPVPRFSAPKSVTFDAAPRYQSVGRSNYDLEGDKPQALPSITAQKPALKRPAEAKPSATSTGFLTSYAQFDALVTADGHFNEREFKKQKKQLLERYQNKQITVT
jgi:hypothetical protein